MLKWEWMPAELYEQGFCNHQQKGPPGLISIVVQGLSLESQEGIHTETSDICMVGMPYRWQRVSICYLYAVVSSNRPKHYLYQMFCKSPSNIQN